MFLFWAALLLQAQTEPTIRIPVRLVEVPTSVVGRDGRFVHGLDAGAFRVYDDDRLQIAKLELVEQPVSVVVAVQTSEGVRDYVPQVRRAARVLESLLGVDGEAAVIAFADQVRVIQYFTADPPLLNRAFRSLPARGDQRRLIDAASWGIDLLKQRLGNRRRILLLISQPEDVGSSATVAATLTQAELNDVHVYSVAMPRMGKTTISDSFNTGGGSGVSLDLMKVVPGIYRGLRSLIGDTAVGALTKSTGGRHLPFRKQQGLEDAIAAIGEEIHNQYILSYTPDHRDLGYHRIRVEVDRPGVTVRTRPGYYWRTP